MKYKLKNGLVVKNYIEGTFQVVSVPFDMEDGGWRQWVGGSLIILLNRPNMTISGKPFFIGGAFGSDFNIIKIIEDNY